MENEANEYYDLLDAACREADIPAMQAAYCRLRQLLERLCRTQATDKQLQLTDLAARINHVAAQLNLDLNEQNRLHSFRLTSNAILNREVPPQRDLLLRDIKTLAFFVKRLTHQDIPDTLYQMLPRADATYHLSSPAGRQVRRMRVSFHHADDTFLYVQPTERVTDTFCRVRYNVEQTNREFQETCRLLWPNAQLNLLDVSINEEGILTPLFIILEPDYLIDISSLAECFREYGHHPANYLLARLQLSENTRPLLTGNIANLFLDEWIYAKDEPDYNHCMKKAFRTYPLELAACEELKERDKELAFFADCRRHFEHIRQTVTETFHASGYQLDKEDAVLEPSYICEALGLQGRLDYMQRDMSSFIEMKSGKADEYTIRGKVEPKENNYVQMLLYQAVLEYSMGINHRKVKSYLLYTRYPLLYPARSSWAMVKRVMDVRNRIVANEYAVQLHNNASYTARLLQQLAPSVLNEKHLNNTLWNHYLSPSIEKTTAALQHLTPIEQHYFYALYNFITKELYTSKSGDTEYEGRRGASGLWLSTLEEKCEEGEILYDLALAENHATEMHKPHLLLRRKVPTMQHRDAAEAPAALPNFREGDAIVLYERNRPADNVTNRMVFKGNIEWMTETTLCIRLRAAQQNSAVLPAQSLYAVEHDYMDTAFRSMYQGLAAFLQANPQRRQLLLGQRMPQTDDSFSQAITSATDDFTRITLKAQAAKDYFLLIGPPGTGKTSRALRSMVETFLKEGKQILLLSYTNRAVDEICKSISSIMPPTDFIRIGSELHCDEAYRPHLSENVLASCHNRREVQERIARCPLFVGTVATLSLHTELFRLKHFDVAIIDEATQILEPQLLGLLCLKDFSGKEAIGKFILIGDHKQLPAVVLQASSQSEVHDEALRSIGLLNLKDSLFERLYRHLSSQGIIASPFCDMLCRQGRMNVEVADFPNHAFYGGVLRPVGLPHQYGPLPLPWSPSSTDDPLSDILTRRVAFLPAEAEHGLQSVKMNHSEARIAAQLSAALYRQYNQQAEEGFDANRTLGIITPYRSQIALIRRELANTGIGVLNQVTVDTVERYQGSERDVIIYSFCVNRLHQLQQLSNLTEENGVWIDRKLNVALTRARKQMFIIGVPHLLRQNPIYARLLQAFT